METSVSPCDAAKQIDELKTKGFPLVFAGDVVGTGRGLHSSTSHFNLSRF